MNGREDDRAPLSFRAGNTRLKYLTQSTRGKDGQPVNDPCFWRQSERARSSIGTSRGSEAESTWLIDEIGVGKGCRAADIGCGPIGVLDLLSDRVGPSGAVVGVEREARFVAMARTEIAKRGLDNVSIVEGDTLSTELEKGTFDLVHERLVLINVPVSNQHAIVSSMVALARPGAIVSTES